MNYLGVARLLSIGVGGGTEAKNLRRRETRGGRKLQWRRTIILLYLTEQNNIRIIQSVEEEEEERG